MTIQQRVLKIADLANSKKRKGDSVIERKGQLNVSRATLWRWVKVGQFPRPFKLGANCTVWCAGEVNAWLASRKEAAK